MEALIVLFSFVAGFVILDVAALTWGVDSRDSLADDHQR